MAAPHSHDHGSGHRHAPGPSSAGAAAELSAARQRRLATAVVANVAIVVAQVVFGIVGHSLGLLADAGHNAADVAALVVSLVAIRMSLRPPTARRSFGSHRFTILASQANAVALLAMTVVLVVEGVGRMFDPPKVHGTLVIGVAAGAMVANLASAAFIRGHAHDDLNMRSAVLHLVGDALASAGVLVAAVVISITGGNEWLDPLASVAIGVLIAVQGFGLLRQANHVLLEGTPSGLDVDELAASMAAVDGVDEVHDLHVWSLSSEMRAMSAHLVLAGHPTLEEAQVVGERVKARLRDGYAIDHATLEMECEACEPDPSCVIAPSAAQPSVSEAVPAAVSAGVSTGGSVVASAVASKRHDRTTTDEPDGSSGSR